jgi:hypothetical protein
MDWGELAREIKLEKDQMDRSEFDERIRKEISELATKLLPSSARRGTCSTGRRTRR